MSEELWAPSRHTASCQNQWFRRQFLHAVQLPWRIVVIHYRPQLMTRFQLGGFMLNLRALILAKYLLLVFRTFRFTYNRQLVALTFGTTLIDVPSRSAQALSTYCQFCTFRYYFHFSKFFFKASRNQFRWFDYPCCYSPRLQPLKRELVSKMCTGA